MVAGRVILLVTSPRLPAGLMTAEAWDVVRGHPVFAAGESELTTALRATGVAVTPVEPRAEALLAALDRHGTVVWLSGPAGDEDLARDLGLRLAREPGRAELELMYGSWDPPGARLLDAVTVMDRLMAPEGGDPWKRAQTHATLAPYLLEEVYEAYDAIVADDNEALREELGDVLLQVVLHARHSDGFDIDDVAGDLVDKLIRRNPHVFAGTAVSGIDEIIENWERIKREEKSRESVLDGLALAQPALSLAAKVLSRLERAKSPVGDVQPRNASLTSVEPAVTESTVDDEAALAAALFGLVVRARALDLDAEAALRKAVLTFATEVRAAETGP